MHPTPPKVWQTADFETTEPARTEPVPGFDLSDPCRYGGFLIHNRPLFGTSVLDTSTFSTH